MAKKDARGGTNNGALIEEYFKKYTRDLKFWLPEGLVEVDIELLQRLGLLKSENQEGDASLTRYFHVMESADKITLINNDFVVWIVPENNQGIGKTYVLIALNKKGIPNLELGFVTSDVYNSSKLVLRILEKLLYEVQENEETIKGIG